MKYKIVTLLAILVFSLTASAVVLPEGFNEKTLLNDLANVIPDAQEAQLEQKLHQFSRTTSTQILVLTVKDLNGQVPAMYAVELGHQLGVGQQGKDNGIVVLVKEKTASSGGEVTIQQGYGIEHLVTDALSKRIIENEMIPAFRQNDYYAGINGAVDVLMDLTKGEYTAENYIQNTGGKPSGNISGLFFLLFIGFIIFTKIISAATGAKRMRSTSMGGRRSDLPFFLLMLTSLNSGGSRHSGSWNSFNSGSGSFGGFSGGGGGFGGFGGGGFGGGGASGSW